jgi:hypothetical protein
MNIKRYVSLGIVLAIMGGFAIAGPVLADTAASSNTPVKAWGVGMMGHGRMGMRPGIIGTVSSVSGNTLTVTGHQGFATTTVTTYTVDATNAKITKNNTAGTISSITSGDTVMVVGTVSGTSVTASMIRDGVMMRGGLGKMNRPENQEAPIVTGDGQPIIGGTIYSINGSSLTITNKSNTQYAVDITNAKITQGPNTITVANLKVGDSVIAQGTINGTAVVATSLTDQTRPAVANGSTTTPRKGFFGGLGQFFAHLFGF